MSVRASGQMLDCGAVDFRAPIGKVTPRSTTGSRRFPMPEQQNEAQGTDAQMEPTRQVLMSFGL